MNRFQNNEDSATTYEEESVQNFREDGSKGSRKVFVSCNHYIHYKCFKRYAQKKRFSTNSFICPLCQTFSNCVIPVAGYSPKPSESSIKELLQNSGAKSNIDHLHQTDPNEDFNGAFNMFLEINKRTCTMTVIGQPLRKVNDQMLHTYWQFIGPTLSQCLKCRPG